MILCKFCDREIEMDEYGWGYTLLEYEVEYYHNECMNVFEGVLMA